MTDTPQPAAEPKKPTPPGQLPLDQLEPEALGEKEILLRTNESTYIPAGHQHRLENPGIIPLVMIEVQSGEYLGEDDIVRFEDTYGRC